MQRFLVMVLFGATWTTIAQATDIMTQSRPFRAGILQMNRALDRQKPLAPSDASGWLYSGDKLFGVYDEHWVTAFHPKEHAFIWWFATKEGVTSPLTAAAGSIFFGTRSGTVFRLEEATGKKIWEQNLDAFSERRFTIAGGQLFVQTATQVLYALDVETGKTLWLYDGGFPDGLPVRQGAAPLVHENLVIMGLANGEIHAVQAQSGKLLWRYNVSFQASRFHDVMGEMLVREGKLIVPRYDGVLAAVDLAGAAKGEQSERQPIVPQENGGASDTAIKKTEHGPDRSNIWSQDLPAITTAAHRNGRIYVGCLNGDVYALETNTGRKIWNVSTGQAVFSITATDQTLYTEGINGRISALATADGAWIWHDDLRGDIAAPPVFVNDILYFPTGLKNLYGYRVK